MADYPTPGNNEFSAEQEQAMRQARALSNRAGSALDSASDTLDHVESRIPTVTGGAPLPQRRPIAAGPDAAGNNRSSNQ